MEFHNLNLNRTGNNEVQTAPPQSPPIAIVQ